MTATAKSQGPLFTRRALFTLIWPLLLEQTLSVTMGMADTLMVAGVGEAAVSSVSLVDSLNILIIQILSALATGGAVIASQYLGRKDEENASRSAAQLYSVLGISTVAVGVVCMLFSRLILRLVFGSIDEDVMRFAQQYFLISAVSYPFIGLYNGGAALFRAQGNSRISMLASLVMNVINIAGNALLIYGFGMGVIGAALATLIGRVFAAVFILWQNQDLHNPLRVPGNTMSLAMIPVIGQCLGAGEKKQAQRYSVTLLGIAITGLAVTNAALFFLMPEVVTWFNLSAEASAMCTHVVHWFNLFSIFFWATSFTLPNALRAGGDAKFTMSVSIVSMWLFRVILSYIFVLQFHLGLTGVWFGMFIDWICRSLCFLVRFARGKWMEHKVI